jgi:tetratricopeptide (TPR) repeat protein
MTVEQASLKLCVAGLTGLIGLATGVTIPATLEALGLLNAIRDKNRRSAAKDLAKAAAAEIDALRASEYAREPHASLFSSALATAAETLDRHRLTSAAFLQLQFQPERAADAVLAHARFNRPDGDDLPAIARRILACFYAKLRKEKDLLHEVVPDVYGEIMRQGAALDRVDAWTQRIEQQTEAALRQLKKESDKKDATIAALEAAVRALARDAEAAPEKPALERALALLAEGKTGEAEAHFREVAERNAESGRQKLTEGADELKEAAAAERHVGALASLRSVADALAAYRRAAALDPDDTWTWVFISQLEQVAGRLPAAKEAATIALACARRQHSVRDENVALATLGDLAVAAGDLSNAVRHFETNKRLFQSLAEADAANHDAQRDLAVSCIKLGDGRRAQRDFSGALDAYATAKAIAEKLTAADPTRVEWQRDLSGSCERIGIVRLAQGDPGGAQDAYGAAKEIREKLAAAYPENAGLQHDLAISWVHIGDVCLAQRDLTCALHAYEESQDKFDKLAAADPANAEWQSDLIVSWNGISDGRIAQGDSQRAIDACAAAKSIAEKLAAADPGNAEWQRNLTVNWNKIGGVRLVQGDLAGALDAFTKTRDILAKLAAADPGNAGWQRDLSLSWNRIGDVRRVQGDRSGALGAYTVTHNTLKKLAAADPGNAEWQSDLIVSHVKLSAVAAETADARAHLVAALAIARAQEAAGRLAPVDAWMPADLEQRLAALDR